MRIAVAGKGGAGKTTMGATLARVLARRGYRVNALDDDPNPNLAVALGLDPEQLRALKRVHAMTSSRSASTPAALRTCISPCHLTRYSQSTAYAARTTSAC